MTNEKRIENMNKEQLLAEFTNFKKLRERVHPSSLDVPKSTVKDDYLSWYFLVRKISKIEIVEVLAKFHFSQDEKDHVTDVLKTAYNSIVTSRLLLASNRIAIPQ
ncbi:hypothetical protein ACIQD3_09395 [Peribacillus loiseleuriae]|uniref:hypothetical protein n=1 Tax=Peribacillus loiseleuriae TaxID=1679170 RepID=UPI00380262E6